MQKQGTTALEAEFSGVYPATSGKPWGRRRKPNDWNAYNVTEPTPLSGICNAA